MNREGWSDPMPPRTGVLEEFARLGEHNRLRFRTYVEREIAPHIEGGEASCTFPLAARMAMARAGCFGRTIDAAHGGIGDRFSGWAIQQEELGRAWAAAAVASTWTNLSGLLLQRFGTAAGVAETLRDMAHGRRLGAVAWTESHGGSDAAALTTTATKVAGGWRLDGDKRLIDNVGGADFFIVGARTAEERAGGISMFLIYPSDAGFVGAGTFDMLGLRPAGVGYFSLENCVVPEERLVGTEGSGLRQMMTMVESGRAGVAAITLGMAESSLEAAVEFLHGRSSFGRSLSKNEAVLARIGHLRTQVEAARQLTRQVARMIDAGEPCQELSAMAKLFASEMATTVIGESMHLHGGIGLTGGQLVQRHFRDIHGFTIGEGTSEIMRYVVGRAQFRD